ncbi:MAG: ABC transporter permease [Rhizobiales bacterium]|nr:ABC transporter permease [Hyphomicrobiales bacterium]
MSSELELVGVTAEKRAKANWFGTQSGLNSLRLMGLAVGIALIALAFGIQKPQFFSAANLLTLLRSMVPLGIIALAQMQVILVGEIDLSVGAVYGLTSVVLAAFWLGGGGAPFEMSLIPAMLLALVTAGLAGLLCGFLVLRAGLPSFIATLGALNIAQGLQLLLGNAATFTPEYNDPLPPDWERSFFNALGGLQVGGSIPTEIFWLFAAAILFWIVRHRTIFGFRLVAIGGNAEAAKVAKLPIVKYKYIVFLLSGLAAGVAGIVDFSYVGSVGPSDAGSLLFSVIAAVVIGGASLSGGRGTVLGTLLGVILLSLLNNGLALLGVGSFAQLLFIGLVTVIAVWIDILSQKLIRKAGQRAAETAGRVLK